MQMTTVFGIKKENGCKFCYFARGDHILSSLSYIITPSVLLVSLLCDSQSPVFLIIVKKFHV